MNDAVILARAGLLDALDALQDHLGALVMVGAQAIYLHTGAAGVALAEFTTDGDLVVDPELLGTSPRIEAAMVAAGFVPDPRASAIGTWLSPRGVPVDLMVPDAVAGAGRRGARVPPHSPTSMRKTRGLEAALVDRSVMAIASMHPRDSRSFDVAVAGPAALLVAKTHKVSDHLGEVSRLDDKDAHDAYRLLRSIDTEVLATSILRLLADDVSAAVTLDALEQFDTLFAVGPAAPGSRMAGRAEELVGNPAEVSESVAILPQDLLAAVRG